MGVWSRVVKPQPNFFLLNRALLEHSWLTKNRSCQLAWIYIIGRASFETGQVNLTEVYRELGDLFESYQWRRFVKRLVKEGMLTAVSVANRGDRIGYEQVAYVANYGKYQGEKSSRKVPERLPEQLPEPLPERYDLQDANTEDDALAAVSAMPERLPVSNKEYSKNLKEKNSSRTRNPELEDPEAYSMVAYASSHYVAEWLRDARGFDFARAVAIWGDSLEELWRAAVSAESRRSGDQAKFRFQDACEGGLELGVRPGGGRPVQGPEAERYAPGTLVSHPVWGEDVVRYYRQDGQVILDNCGATVPPGEVTPCLN